MGSQENMSSQNTKQTGEKPVGQSAADMEKSKPKYLMIVVAALICIVLFGLGGLYLSKQNQPSLSPITTSTPTPTATVTYTTDNWITYTDTKSGFSLQYPGDYFTYQGDPALGFIWTTSAPEGGKGPKLLGENDARLGASSADFSFQTLDEYLSKRQSLFGDNQTYNSKKSVVMDGISGYKVTYSFQTKPEGTPSTTLYASDGMVIKNGKRYTVSLSSFNQKLLENKQAMFDQILSSFKFLDSSNNTIGNTNNYNTAIKILQAVPEIQIIENAVIKNGRKTSFSSAGGENGDVVTVLFFEGGFPDQHTSRIDTFMVNVKTNEIQIYDPTSLPNKNFSLEEWKKAVKIRFQ